ncbi:hypothetical protein APR04_005711 [Promicromonospora umidemergens]|uniref:Uncharacterized protein n=1 Tax=Promicromonospora umidemergens TaxID=629679 RepID=A0ABP8Y052_9MICO|nr:hypothetical protein [Promicromonospora umidemergens]
MVAVPSVTGVTTCMATVAAVVGLATVTAVVGVHGVLVGSAVPVVRRIGAVVAAVIVAVLIGCTVPRVHVITREGGRVVMVLVVTGGPIAGRHVVVLVVLAHGDQPSLGGVDGQEGRPWATGCSPTTAGLRPR